MIQVIHRAFDILELLSKASNRTVPLSEISQQLKLNAGTCANILKTMVQRNYVEQAGAKKGYKLGPMAYSLTGNIHYSKELEDAAKPFMEELTAELNEASVLAIRKENKRLVIYEVMANQDLLVKTSKEKPAYDSSTGRVLIASMTDRDINEFLDKYGLPPSDIWPNADSREKFFKEIEEIRRNGEAYQFTQSHICGIAVPVYKNNQVIASLSIYLPEIRLTREKERAILKNLKLISERITQKIEGKVAIAGQVSEV